MRTGVSRADLARVLTAISRIVETRNTIPILGNVLLTASGNTLTARGTDLDVEMTATIACEGDDGVACVPAKNLADIVKRLVGDTVDLEKAGGTLAVKSGRSRFKLPCLNPAGFPSLSGAEFTHSFTANLAELMVPVAFASGSDDQRYYLNGVRIHAAEDRLRAVATDGHRLAMYSVGLPDGAAGLAGVTIPNKVVSLLCGIRADVAVDVCDNRIRVTNGDTVIVSKLIEGEFPQYERVIPKDNDRTITIKRAEMVGATSRVGLVASDIAGKAVRLDIAPGQIILTASDRDGRDAVDEIAVEFDGEPTWVAYNCRYLDEMLGSAPGDEVVFDVLDNQHQTRVRSVSNEHFVGVLTPFRVAA